MSVQASSWAWGCRTGDSTRKSVLAAFANHAHADGTSAFPSIETVAEHVECSDRTAQRHLKVLLDEGFMRPGDQELVSHIRADRRPVVYDLAMSEATRLEWRADAQEHPEAGVTDCHPADPAPGDTDVTPQQAGGVTHGVTPMTPRGDAGVTRTEGTSRTTPQAPTTGCPGCRGQRPCRACGTTPRQLEAAAIRDAQERRRAEADEAIQADRRRKAETADVDAAAHALEARKLIAAGRTGGGDR